jgi:acyl-CoA dehydrogenase
MEITEFLDPFNRILDQHCAPVKLREIESADSIDSLIGALDNTGYLDALCSEEKGGAGLTLSQAEPLIRAIGAHGAPAEIALEMVKRAADSEVSRPLSAVIHGVLIAGAIETLLSMCVEYANMRVQFGKPIGKQQAIQHQIAQLAEQSVLVKIAAQYGAEGGLNPSLARAAIAKQTASAAVPLATSVAHSVHGAIGITEAFDLHLYTKQLYAWRLTAGSEGYWAGILGKQRLAQADTSSVDFMRAVV